MTAIRNNLRISLNLQINQCAQCAACLTDLDVSAQRRVALLELLFAEVECLSCRERDMTDKG